MKYKILTYYIILFSPLLLDYGHVFFWDYKHESGICNIPFTLPFTVKQIMTKDKHDTLKNIDDVSKSKVIHHFGAHSL